MIEELIEYVKDESLPNIAGKASRKAAVVNRRYPARPVELVISRNAITQTYVSIILSFVAKAR